MDKTEWTISQNYWDYEIENTLFTYSKEEQEKIRLAKKIYEQEIWKLEYFTFYQIQLENWMSESQAILYNFIEWYTKTNRDFFYSNETISEKLKWGKDKINNVLKELEKEWYITVKKRIKSWWWLNRFIKTTWKGNPDLLIRKNRIWEIWKTELDNSEKPTEVLYNSNINYSNYYINNTEQSSENQKENNSLSLSNSSIEEKEKSSAKKEKEMQELWKREKIDYLINQIKSICDGMNIAYDKTMDRQFAKHILTAKEYGEFCEKIKQDRITFALNVLIASIKINYWKWPLAWPKKIYQNYADLYNQAKQKAPKIQTPTINVL